MDTPDEIRENNFREKNQDLFPEIDSRTCDSCCLDKDNYYVSPDGGGYVCKSCLIDGSAKKFYLENNVTEEQFNALIKKL